MKLLLVLTVLAAGLSASCAHPLETVVEERHQARIDASNANQPLTNGAGDGLGRSFAQSQMSFSLHAAIQDP